MTISTSFSYHLLVRHHMQATCGEAMLKIMEMQAIESLDISDALEITAMTSKEKERVPFDVSMQATGESL